MAKDDIILKALYPKIETKLNSNMAKIKNVIKKHFEERGQHMHDIGPFERIPYGQYETDQFLTALGISEKEILALINDAYYMKIANFNPSAAKNALTVAITCIIRKLVKDNKSKDAELFSIYLSFTGKFYPSIHYGSYPVVAPAEYRHIMEHVINNKLSNRFDIKSEGSLFGAIRATCTTWLSTYEKDMFKRFEDEDVVYLIQQLHDRIKSFMINIAEVYYDTYDKKDSYMTYDSDNLDEDNYHVADNDSLKIERGAEQAMNLITTSSIDYKICKMASDSNVKTDEVKSIMESILNDVSELVKVKEFIRLLITEYCANSKTKDIRDIDFISKSITPKPNSKNPNVIRQKEILEEWLSEKSPAYRKRKSREATKSSYHKSVTTYLVLITHGANK